MSEADELMEVAYEWGVSLSELEAICAMKPKGEANGVKNQGHYVLRCAELMREFADEDRMEQAVKRGLPELGGKSLIDALRAGRGREMAVWLEQIDLEPPRLSVELVPGPSWGANVRALLTSSSWGKVRKQVYEEADHCCEICGGVGQNHPLDAHEVWGYDDTNKVQTLERLIALCPDCHEVKHMGRTEGIGDGEKAMRHLESMNGWSSARAKRYVDEAFSICRERSQHEWTLDLQNLVTQYGISSEEIVRKLDRDKGGLSR